MNINQNNYESFFLLYVDNELSATDKLCVEAFIGENPHLAAELRVLQNMVLPLEESQLIDKTALYRSAGLEGNIQEAMLLQIDNELPEALRSDLVSNIEADVNMLTSWEQLKNTKLDAKDIIPFPQKQSLYRREKKGTVVYGRFTRWAVAAALIAAGFFAGLMLTKDKDQAQTEVAQVPSTKTEKGNELTRPGQTATPAIETGALTAESNSTANPGLQNGAPQMAEVAEKNRSSNSTRREIAGNAETAKVPGSKIVKEAPPYLNPKSQPVLVAATDKLNIQKPDRQEVSMVLASVGDRPKQPVEIIDRNLTPTESTYAYSTIMEEPQQNDNHILFMDEETVARTKAGIFFKKLKRTVTRSTNIKTGNSLKIAGFEFAVK